MDEYHFCDVCFEQIPPGVTAWMVKTGEIDDELKVPIVRILCNDCHG